PVNGTVDACNADMEDTPSLVNVSCYDKGWLVRIKPDNPADVDALLDAAGYKKTL
ncbi:MAG: glycine cleavage system protein H, partial [Desulfovibrio sp.]|nr:glycine cleavage system protein H [Desulfovibrio sp.]